MLTWHMTLWEGSSGSAKREGLAGACALAVYPCDDSLPSFHSVMQHQFFELHSAILHTNKGQLFGGHNTTRQDFERKFSTISPSDTPGHSLREGLAHSAPTWARSLVVPDTQTIMCAPLKVTVLGSHLCPSKNWIGLSSVLHPRQHSIGHIILSFLLQI